MPGLFASALSKIGPRAAKPSASSRAAVEFWERLFGTNSQSDDANVGEQPEHVAATQPQEEEVAQKRDTGVTSRTARNELQDFVRQMNWKSRSDARWGLHQRNNVDRPPPPQSPPSRAPAEDLRVPVQWGSSQMVHLEQ